MNIVKLNTVSLNSISLNAIGQMVTRGEGGGGGGEPVPDTPAGYELFLAMDGVFSAADGDFYVKL